MVEIRDVAGSSIHSDAAVVMPDRVHLIFRLFHEQNLSSVLKQIKGRAARNINRLLNRQGRLWIEESFDHIIRNTEELEEKIAYVMLNPVKKGIVACPADYKWLLVGGNLARHTG